MPLFKHDDSHRAATQTSTSPTRKGSLFGGRRRSTSQERAAHSTHQNSGGFFNRRRSPSSERASGRGSGSMRSGGSGGFLGIGGNNHGIGNDPSIMSARQKVEEAEHAEREADQALHAARLSVKEARDHVKFLEKDAADDARRAKAKQAEAKVVSKTARALGRHG